MSNQLSDAEKAKIRQEVVAEFNQRQQPKPKKFSDLIRLSSKPKESYADYKARIASLKAEGKLTFQDLIRIV